MITLQYRKTTDTDYPLLFQLDMLAFNRPFDTCFRDVAELTDLLKGTAMEIVYINTTPVGYYSYSKKDTETEIIGIVVIPEYQQKGIGTDMLTKILKELHDVKQIKIVTHPKNIAAINLYKKFGFTEDHIDPSYYGENEPRVVMFKNN